MHCILLVPLHEQNPKKKKKKKKIYTNYKKKKKKKKKKKLMIRYLEMDSGHEILQARRMECELQIM